MTTSPYLDAKILEYENHRKAVDLCRTTSTVRALNQAELRSVIAHGEAASALYGEIEDLRDEQARTDQVEEMHGRVAAAVGDTTGTGVAAAATPTGLHALMPSTAELAQLRSAIEQNAGLRFTTSRLPRTEQEKLQMRAAVTLSLTGGAIGGIDGSLPEPRRLAAAVGLCSHPSTHGRFSGPKFGATTATAATAEGGQAGSGDGHQARHRDQAVRPLDDAVQNGVAVQPGVVEQFVSWHAMAIAKDEDKMIIDASTRRPGRRWRSPPATSGSDPQGDVRRSRTLSARRVTWCCATRTTTR